MAQYHYSNPLPVRKVYGTLSCQKRENDTVGDDETPGGTVIEMVGGAVIRIVLIDKYEAEYDGGDDEEVEVEEGVKLIMLHEIHQYPRHHTTNRDST